MCCRCNRLSIAGLGPLRTRVAAHRLRARVLVDPEGRQGSRACTDPGRGIHTRCSPCDPEGLQADDPLVEIAAPRRENRSQSRRDGARPSGRRSRASLMLCAEGRYPRLGRHGRMRPSSVPPAGIAAGSLRCAHCGQSPGPRRSGGRDGDGERSRLLTALLTDVGAGQPAPLVGQTFSLPRASKAHIWRSNPVRP